MEELSLLTGKNISSLPDLLLLYHLLTAELAMNYKLPEWTKQYYPNGKLLDASNLYYEVRSYNKRLRRLNGGLFF